ncbi:MAG: radical SAM family heme chaperone HemW [Candidatus Sabulitectum sp.]|nr:radical SAM family heme chaperone HemW [Candidatus Sabulitectum sp.]
MTAEGTGLYVHVPFCLKKCSYCAFTSVKKPDDTSGMCSALHTEFIQRTRNRNIQFRTFYAGGGTPSLLPPEFWMRLIGAVKTPSMEEVTIETNPAVLDAVGYSALFLAGFNRISVGVQSFSDMNLKLLGRIHSADEARESLKLARKMGFRNISLDLMYGLPGQTSENQKKDIEEALLFMPQHISAYDLTLEPGTPMGDRGEKASENQCAEMYYRIHEMLTANGYIHYEVSSYALEDKYRSKHNSSYWDRTPYIGIGPSAHSFTGAGRSWNVSDIPEYESSVVQGNLPEEFSEELTDEDAAHEILALGFRNTNGVDLKELERFGFKLDLADLLNTGFVKKKGNLMIPNTGGMLFADYLALKAAELLEEVPRV